MTTTRPFELMAYHEKDWIDDFLESLSYLGPIGALVAGGAMLARRMPILVDVPVALYRWIETGELPKSMPRLDELIPTARPLVIEMEAKRAEEAKFQAEQATKRNEEVGFYKIGSTGATKCQP